MVLLGRLSIEFLFFFLIFLFLFLFFVASIKQIFTLCCVFLTFPWLYAYVSLRRKCDLMKIVAIDDNPLKYQITADQVYLRLSGNTFCTYFKKLKINKLPSARFHRIYYVWLVYALYIEIRLLSWCIRIHIIKFVSHYVTCWMNVCKCSENTFQIIQQFYSLP